MSFVTEEFAPIKENLPILQDMITDRAPIRTNSSIVGPLAPLKVLSIYLLSAKTTDGDIKTPLPIEEAEPITEKFNICE